MDTICWNNYIKNYQKLIPPVLYYVCLAQRWWPNYSFWQMRGYLREGKVGCGHSMWICVLWWLCSSPTELAGAEEGIRQTVQTVLVISLSYSCSWLTFVAKVTLLKRNKPADSSKCYMHEQLQCISGDIWQGKGSLKWVNPPHHLPRCICDVLFGKLEDTILDEKIKCYSHNLIIITLCNIS